MTCNNVIYIFFKISLHESVLNVRYKNRKGWYNHRFRLDLVLYEKDFLILISNQLQYRAQNIKILAIGIRSSKSNTGINYNIDCTKG